MSSSDENMCKEDSVQKQGLHGMILAYLLSFITPRLDPNVVGSSKSQSIACIDIIIVTTHSKMYQLFFEAFVVLVMASANMLLKVFTQNWREYVRVTNDVL